MQDSILLVDDEPNVISSLKRALLDEPYEIYSAGSAAEGLKILDRNQDKGDYLGRKDAGDDRR